MLTYGSVCSGIEAVTVAWVPLGFRPAWFAEIDPFCSAVLAHHYPESKNYGDFTKIEKSPEPIDILVGGTPCQSFSVAGKRGGLDDPRGNLAIEFCRLAGRLRARWIVWENVPGVLSSGGGRDFGAIIGTLAELGYGCAWRVLDAQYFGVPQRRRRVFVVGYFGDWRPAAAVLFEPEGLCRYTPSGRKARQAVASLTAHGVGTCGADDNQAQAGHLIPFVGGNTAVLRRLTPRECERLQGFPDDYTLIPYRGKLAADSLRYRAIGNAMAVPVVRWIGERILETEKVITAG
jgi:DNA (cytosine-5)-methyltransferase 1